MKRIIIVTSCFISLQIFAQDTTMNSLLKDMDSKTIGNEKKRVKIFNSYKAINATTTEMTGKGKMDFNVTHNFGDIAGKNGGIKNFYGLDNAADIRIGFHIGLGPRFDLILARIKGYSVVQNLWQMGFKYQLLQQLENDPSHPLSIAVYADAVMATQKRSRFNNRENSFTDLSDRITNTVELILARKMGKVSLQLNPVFITRGYTLSYDQKNMFALGGAIRLPLSKNINLIIDYFHPFRNQSSKDGFATDSLSGSGIKRFYDPLGVGFEFITAGHIFHMNFTNATEILESRFIPRTITSWGKGQFRWGFTISRTFVLWREKKK